MTENFQTLLLFFLFFIMMWVIWGVTAHLIIKLLGLKSVFGYKNTLRNSISINGGLILLMRLFMILGSEEFNEKYSKKNH